MDHSYQQSSSTGTTSRGSVTLNLKNIEEDPLVDFNYLSDPYDMEVLVEGIKISLKIFEKTPAYQKFEAYFPTTPWAALDLDL